LILIEAHDATESVILSVSRQLPRAFLFTNILRAPLVSGEVATGKIQSSDRATETFGGRAL
jgi:hypothetical protein